MKFLHTFLITLIIFNSLLLSVKADEELFIVKDSKSGLKETFETYNEAINYYEDKNDLIRNFLIEKCLIRIK